MTPGKTELRPYQQEAVNATLEHFRKSDSSALLVLPTGAGKSLIIAELGRLARHSILVLAHVQELVAQNAEKYAALGLTPGIFSAGLSRRENEQQVTFASIQSVSANLELFEQRYSLIIIDECHRISDQEDSQYQQLISQLKKLNPGLKVLGLTATPYRLGYGWIYRYHYRGFVRATETRIFERCIYELPISTLINQGFLTPPRVIDAAVEHYDFSALTASASGSYPESALNELLDQCPRVTEAICREILQFAEQRQGVMIFAASVKHAREIQGYLPPEDTALLIGSTDADQRSQAINAFKEREIKFLVNVAVLTTGFDAPHVDLIAILRPTASVSLYQQIAGRGLRLSEGKRECLIIDYANNGIDLYHPEVGSAKPAPDTEPVQVFCPECGHANIFWGRTSPDGQVTEHFGRRCQGLIETDPPVACNYRFRFKSCPHCNAENDIAARDCTQCHQALIDPDDLLKKTLSLKDRFVMRCQAVTFEIHSDKVKLTYHDEDGETLSESFNLSFQRQREAFNTLFIRRLNQQIPPIRDSRSFRALGPVRLPHPDFVIAAKDGKFWRVKERLFDYSGRYRKANELS